MTPQRGAYIKVSGLEAAIATVRGVGAAAQRLSGTFLSIGSPLPYARFIETGKSSRQTRRAGPAWMFRDGVREAMQRAPALLGKAIVAGEQATTAAIADLEQQATTNVQRRTPVRTGALRASVRAIRRPRGT